MPDLLSPPLVALTKPWNGIRRPLVALERLSRRRPHPFLRLAAGPGFRGRPWSVLCAGPVHVTEVPRWRAGTRLDEVLRPLRPRRVRARGPRVPFRGGFAGFLGYEARSGVERSPAPRRSPLGFPALWLGEYDAALLFDHHEERAFITGVGRDEAEAEAALAALGRDLRRGARRVEGEFAAGAPRARIQAAAYLARVREAREAVARGDVFQSNISQRFDARIEGGAQQLFARLVDRQPAPYMSYVDAGAERYVLSASPERFLRVRGRVCETDPMKGTRPRGATEAEDRALRRELERSEKERAELAMIVDLSRNDLARVCEAGTVRVKVARRLLRFAGVHQAIAVVQGKLVPGEDRVDLLQAAFPPGSVTGAPKVRAMEIIDELEGEGRGPYCGAIGWFDYGGDMDLSVAIRTILLGGGRATYRVGGGITLRSDPEAELEETLAKGRGMFATLAGRGAPA